MIHVGVVLVWYSEGQLMAKAHLLLLENTRLQFFEAWHYRPVGLFVWISPTTGQIAMKFSTDIPSWWIPLTPPLAPQFSGLFGWVVITLTTPHQVLALSHSKPKILSIVELLKVLFHTQLVPQMYKLPADWLTALWPSCYVPSTC